MMAHLFRLSDVYGMHDANPAVFNFFGFVNALIALDPISCAH